MKSQLVRIALYTVRDQIRFRSFYALLGVCVLFLFIIRGCYGGQYTVNGEQVKLLEIAWQVSLASFHIIASGAMLIAMLLAMRLWGRDREDGALVQILSRPVGRHEYILGRVLGIWTLATLFMFVLHATIFIIAYLNTRAIIPGYLIASLICSLNLLFVVTLVCLLSFFMPEFMAALAAIALVGIGFASDTFYQIMQNQTVQSAIGQQANRPAALWRMLWPKMTELQYGAAALIKNDVFQAMGPVHPAINVAGATAVCMILLLIYFRRKEL
jgi:ABC-type transport system involved in multi-copper enzyme maturation permease subunit